MIEGTSRAVTGGATKVSLADASWTQHNPSSWLRARVAQRLISICPEIRWDGSSFLVLPLAIEYGPDAFRDNTCSRCGDQSGDDFTGLIVRPTPFITFFGGLCPRCDEAEWGDR